MDKKSTPVSMRRAALAALLAGFSMLAILPAHADEGKPRYVSGKGRDTGDCLNRFRPCRSLDYAISRAGKGDPVRVAEGEYVIRDARQLTALLSVQGRLEGGFSGYSSYSERTAREQTILIGVPPELRERYESAGFSVIVDTKGVQDGPDAGQQQQMRKLAQQVRATELSHASAPCAGGVSSGFACQSISLLSHLSLQDMKPVAARGNDVWGYVDLNTGREYVIMGVQIGLAVVDVTDPTAPKQVGTANGAATTWRDIKIYQRYDQAARRWRAYAYVTADAVTDFMIVLDLSGLPNSIEQLNFSTDFRAAHNVQMSGADYTYGLATSADAPVLAIAGAGTSGGNHRLYSLAQPQSPSLVRVSTAGYAHDLAFAALGDARSTTQCVNALSAPRCQVLADFNENSVDIWDVTLPGSAQRLSSLTYPNASYVHSGWFTEDGRYLLVHDELDEQNAGLNTTVRVLDLANLQAPQLAATWTGPTRATDHNGFVKGNRYYVANYAAGLTVLDLTNPRAPQRVGYFDSYPSSDATGFVGAWGVYPFLASGTVAVADINSGLYLLKNETLASTAGSFVVATPSVTGAEGQSPSITVSRTGGSAGPVSVEFEVLRATADGTDATPATFSLSWADGETQNKTATVNLLADGVSEDMELLLVRLKNPQGGATLGYPDTAHVHIRESGATTRLRLLESAIKVDEARGQAFITVTRHGSTAGEARVNVRTLPNSSYSGFTPIDTQLVWPDGVAEARIATTTINAADLSGGQSANFQVELSSPANATLENSSGANAATLTATVTVTDSAAAPPTPNPPSTSSGKKGGGGADPFWLALLGAVAFLRTVRPRRI